MFSIVYTGRKSRDSGPMGVSEPRPGPGMLHQVAGFPSSPGPSNPTREPRARAGMLESIPACMESRAVSGPVTLPVFRIVPSRAVSGRSTCEKTGHQVSPTARNTARYRAAKVGRSNRRIFCSVCIRSIPACARVLVSPAVSLLQFACIFAMGFNPAANALVSSVNVIS